MLFGNLENSSFQMPRPALMFMAHECETLTEKEDKNLLLEATWDPKKHWVASSGLVFPLGPLHLTPINSDTWSSDRTATFFWLCDTHISIVANAIFSPLRLTFWEPVRKNSGLPIQRGPWIWVGLGSAQGEWFWTVSTAFCSSSIDHLDILFCRGIHLATYYNFDGYVLTS